MRIAVVADGRSPITCSWLQGLIALRHEVILISTFPCHAPADVQTVILPVAFAGMAGSQAGGKSGGAQSHARKVVSRARSTFLDARYILGPMTIPGAGRQFRSLINKMKPDLVHALRVPFEGMLASYTPHDIPLVVSIWGNDLTLHVNGSSAMRRWTRKTLKRADGLIADANRDIRLSRMWGFPDDRPSIKLPGGGGVDLVEVNHARSDPESDISFPARDIPLIINPRGFRPNSVRNDVFFQAIPLVLAHNKDAQFWCAGMAGQPEANAWVDKLGIGKNVVLLPYMEQSQLWSIFCRATCSVTISSHDGTPNSLLEAMGCGCFPIAGDIESIREWITPGINGYLVQPDLPEEVSQVILSAIEKLELRKKAAEMNQRIISERADMNLVRSQLQAFYQRIVT